MPKYTECLAADKPFANISNKRMFDNITRATISIMEPSLGNNDKIDCCRLRESEMTPCLQVFNQRSLEFAYQKFVQKKSQSYALVSFMVSFLGLLVTIVSRTKWVLDHCLFVFSLLVVLVIFTLVCLL